MLKRLLPPIKWSYLHSRVARRLFALFVLCALLPVSVLAAIAYFKVTYELQRQAYQRLRQTSKTAGLTVYERLTALDTDLQIILGHLDTEIAVDLTDIPLALQDRIATRMVGLALFTDSGRRLTSLGLPPSMPHLRSQERQHLATGKTLVFARATSSHEGTLFIARRMSATHTNSGILIGVIHPRYLWGQDLAPPPIDLVVRDHADILLFAPVSGRLPPQELTEGYRHDRRAQPFTWSHEDTTYIGHGWTLFMQPTFLDSWTLVTSQSRLEILSPLRSFRVLFPLVALLAFWVVALLSLAQIRRHLVPIEQLHAATQQLAAEDFSARVQIETRDEFAVLGASFNTMAARVEHYAQAMETLNRIGVSLSTERDIAQVLRLVMRGAQLLTHADGGAFYFVVDQQLTLAIAHNATNDNVLATHAPIPLYDLQGAPNTDFVAVAAILQDDTINLSDVAAASGFGDASFANLALPPGVQVHACLAVPMKNLAQELVGVLQLFKTRHASVRPPEPFLEDDQQVAEALASQAAVMVTKHRLTQALQASENRYRALVEHNPGPICMHDLSGVLLFVNTAWSEPLGYTAAEMIGCHLGAFLVPTTQSLFSDYLVRISQEQTFDGTIKLVAKDGKERLWLYRALRYEEPDTTPYVYGHAQDITERKQLEAQVQQAQKMQAIGTLAGGIAHDFNNILTAIIGYTELTLDDIPPDSQAEADLQGVLTAGLRAKDLVRQILMFSRQDVQERQPLELHLLVKEVLKLLRASLPVTISIHEHLDPQTGTVLANPTHMHQVLMNLGANAAHAMRDSGGVLEIRLAPYRVEASDKAALAELQPGPHVLLTVRDTGHGMAPEVMARIFEPFFTTKGIGEGTGMGLAVIHGIITDHGGMITVESHPGQGTTFQVYLPASEPIPNQEEVPDEPLPGGGEHILFVDDEAALVQLGQRMLTRLGYKVTACQSSVEALQRFQQAPQDFDLVVTDQTMPEMTGDRLTHELRQLRPDIPIVMCTGFSRTIAPAKAHTTGIDAVCMKPLVAGQVARAIRQVLGHPVVQTTEGAINGAHPDH